MPYAAQAVNGQERRRSEKRKSKSIEDPVGDGLSFWEFTASLGDRWLSGDLKTVIYRTWPRIDKQQDKVYLSIVQEAPSEESLLQAYGSGRYLMFIKDKGKLLRKHVVSVSHPAYPPKVNESEVVRDDPANDAYFRGWARKSNKDGPEKKEPVAGGDINSVLTTVLEKAGSFDPKLAELWQSTAQQRDELSKALAAKNAPPDFVTQVKGLKGICPTLFEPPAAPPPAPTQQLDTLTLLKLVKELQPAPQNPLQILEQAKNIFAPEGTAENPKTDEISRLDQILTFATKLANLRVGDGGHRNGWEIGLDYGRDLGIPILQMVQNVMRRKIQDVEIRRQRQAGVGSKGVDPCAPPSGWSLSASRRRTAGLSKKSAKTRSVAASRGGWRWTSCWRTRGLGVSTALRLQARQIWAQFADCPNHLRTLELHRVRFVGVTQDIDTDRADAAGRFLLHILAAAAEFERELIRERATAGMHVPRRGKQLGRPKAVFRRD